jgi:hypothetical protein
MSDGQIVQYQVGMTLAELEKLAILKAFAHFRYNKTTTAASLDIAIRTLDNKLEKYAHEENELKEKQANAEAKRAEHLARARGNPPNNVGIPYNPSALNHTSFERHFPIVPRATSGLPMESIANSASQSPVPMPERQEVQKVLPSDSSKGSPKKGR